jgi:uncharacterized OB-fold protein
MPTADALITSFKAPVYSEHSAPFFAGLKEEKLVVQRCRPHGHVSHPPGPVCKTCMADELEWIELSGEGEVYTYTTVHRPMHEEFRPDTPFTLVYVRLDGGPTIVSWLREVDLDQVDPIGMRVKAVYEQIDDRVTLHRFVPVEA